MPRANKQRGRRAEHKENKRKSDDSGLEGSHQAKRPKLAPGIPVNYTDIHDGFKVVGEAGEDYIAFGLSEDNSARERRDDFFVGFLTPEEQEYYASINAKLDANDFESIDDQSHFIEAVHRESHGKELKIACSQSSSRQLERLIHLSSWRQIKSLFEALLGQLSGLVTHRFGSHVVETVLKVSAAFVGSDKGSDEGSTMEELLIQAADELRPDLGFLLTDKFASHVVRTLLLILSGEPLQPPEIQSNVETSIVERDGAAGVSQGSTRQLPSSFKQCLDELSTTATSGLETSYLRALATHPTGNPVLQILLRLEMKRDGKAKIRDDRSLFRRLLPDEDLERGSDSTKFIHGLIYDATGSRLLETIIEYVPGGYFKKLYRNVLQPRMVDMAKNDIASYVASRILERLGKDDLQDAVHTLLPEFSKLIARHRLGLIKVLIERCAVRHANIQPLARALLEAYGRDPSVRLVKMLWLDASFGSNVTSLENEEVIESLSTDAIDIHGALLAQSMLLTNDTAALIQPSLVHLSPTLLLKLTTKPATSRLLQAVLVSQTSEAAFLRQFIPLFSGHLTDMATNGAGSHVLDALWNATVGSLHFLKDRAAAELAESESSLRESSYGRIIWRNWAMDLYIRKRAEWTSLAKEGQKPELVRQTTHSETRQNEVAREKTAIEKARARFAEKKRMEMKNKSHTHPA